MWFEKNAVILSTLWLLRVTVFVFKLFYNINDVTLNP